MSKKNRKKNQRKVTRTTGVVTSIVLLVLAWQVSAYSHILRDNVQMPSGASDMMVDRPPSPPASVATSPRTNSSRLQLTNQSTFTIIVLTMNRFASLERLLRSLQSSEYGSDMVNLVIRFDRPKDPTAEWWEEVERIRSWMTMGWTPGNASVTVASKTMGLRRAWLEAWKPATKDEQAIIFEDDVEVSPIWYRWLQGAHEAYQGRTDIAGMSLQRQTLVPFLAAQNNQIPDNDGQPFLYRLVGSIGYSPKASVWMDFLDFAECALATDMDVSVSGLITSQWYNSLDKRTMWTQLFIYFCNSQQLSTLYWFPPHDKALAAHWREKGEHHGATQGRDFDLVDPSEQSASLEFPTTLVSLDWDAKPTKPRPVLRSLVMSVAMGYGWEEFHRFVVGLRKHYQGSIALLISTSTSPQIKQMLVDNNVIVVETSEQGGPRLSPAWKRIIKSRYTFYRESCQEDVYDLCMMVDFRDVLFQGDPFAQMLVPTYPSLHLYLHNIRVNAWTINEVAKCAGGDASWIRGEWLINAGGTIASPSIIPHLAGLNEAFGLECDDQVALNLAVYGKKIPGAEIILHKQGTGSINNAAWGGEFRKDSHQRILNHDCFPSPVVHQFDVIESTRAIANAG